MKRGNSGIDALIAVDKPLGMTSHDVVDRIRRVTGEGRVGHCGTLDPAASGVLLVGIGSATRLSPYLMGHDKVYRARIAFGAATDTDDADGRVIATAGCPDALFDHDHAAQVVSALTGDHLQVPPAYSAIKRDGVVSYRAAREGNAIVIEPRPCTVLSARLDALEVVDGLPVWEVVVEVSKGTYIRALARDLGESCGSRAHLCGLRRLRSGNVDVASCTPLDRIEAEGYACACINPVTALGMPSVQVVGDDILSVIQGKRIEVPTATPEGPVCIVSTDRLLAIHECHDGTSRPRIVFAGGVTGV